jgi:Arc/MetJ family transcription regulator
MRTNIVIDDELMKQASEATGLPTKRAVVEAGLRLLVQLKAQAGLRRLRGKVRWQGNLQQQRQARSRNVV